MNNKISNRRNGFYFRNGKFYPSVTTILQVIAKPELIHWAAKTAARAALANPSLSEQEAAGAIYSRRDEAGNLGRTVHSFVEAWKNGHVPSLEGLDAAFVPYAKAFVRFTEEHPMKFLEHEKEVYSETYGYAGTLDILAEDATGKKWVLDVKTSGQVYPEAGLQLVAYAYALGGKPQMGVIHLRPNETYSLTETKESMRAFLAAKALWEWKEADKIAEVKKFMELKHKEVKE